MRADNSTAINFTGIFEPDFGIAAGGGILDIGIRKELVGSEAGIEMHLDFLPQGIVTIALDGVKDGNKHGASGKGVVHHVDFIDTFIVGEQIPGSII